MSASNSDVITLEFLRVANPDVLGASKTLSIVPPCSFSNAPGALRDVDNFAEIRATAHASAVRLKAALLEPAAV